MDEWVKRALAKWPDVPALYGWLRLNRRGQWLIQGDRIVNQRIIDVINRNYDVDERGCWFFQNGPQRGYMALDYAPFLLRAQPDGSLITHNALVVENISGAYMDEESNLTLVSEHGPGLLDDHDLEWLLSRLRADGHTISDDDLARALQQPDAADTGLTLETGHASLPVIRCDAQALPQTLGFVREPEAPESDH